MSELLQIGIFLMVVGMLAVFTVLALVVVTGKVLIYAVNGRPSVTSGQPVTKTIVGQKGMMEADPAHVAVIAAAVQVAGSGRARITNIELAAVKHE